MNRNLQLYTKTERLPQTAIPWNYSIILGGTLNYSTLFTIYILQTKTDRSHSSVRYLSHAYIVTKPKKVLQEKSPLWSYRCLTSLFSDSVSTLNICQVYSKIEVTSQSPSPKYFEYSTESRLVPPKESEKKPSESSQSPLDYSESTKKSIFLFIFFIFQMPGSPDAPLPEMQHQDIEQYTVNTSHENPSHSIYIK